MQLVFTCTVYRGRTTRHSRPQLVLARRAHHTPLSRSVSFCMQLLFCMHRGHTTRHSRAQLVHACSCFFACTAGTPHATLALSWFLHARRAHHTPLSRSVGFCMQLVFACTVGNTHAALALSRFMHAVAFLHARRAHHTPLSRSVGLCMHGGHTTRHPRAQLVLACTVGTPHATLALSWFMHAVAFLHARWAHHTPLTRSVGSCMQLVFACTARNTHATLALS